MPKCIEVITKRFFTRVHSKMNTSIVLCATAVVLVQILYVSAAGGERPQQQLPLFFQGSRPFNAPGAPLPKFVGIAGGQTPQAFHSPQVDEDQDDDEQQHNEDEPHQRNVLAPTPLPFRPQPTQQQVRETEWFLNSEGFFFPFWVIDQKVSQLFRGYALLNGANILY